MDTPRFFDITESAYRIHHPLSPAMLAALGMALRPSAAQRLSQPGPRRQAPHESLVYVADSAHAPYGDRDAAFIAEQADALSGFLADSGVKAIVVACNTATVVAVDTLRARFELPIVALEPAIKPAAALSRSGVVAVLATSRTLESASVQRLRDRHAGQVRVLLQPCPGLVERVERGELDDETTMRLLESYVRPVVDAVSSPADHEKAPRSESP